jgi:hypothetical protein
VLIGAPAQRQLGEMLRKVRDCRSRLDGAPDLPGDSVLKLELATLLAPALISSEL